MTLTRKNNFARMCLIERSVFKEKRMREEKSNTTIHILEDYKENDL